MSKKQAVANKKRGQAGTSGDTCFTIMPFATWFDYYYETIYVPAIKSTGLTPRRADDLYRPSAIVHDIWALTQQAKVVLADLSGKNPNVFYELGLAHALAKPAILVTDSMEDVPFDLRSLRVIVYDKNEPNWGEVLQRKISSAIKEVLAAPLEAVLPTFLKVNKSTTKTTVSKEEKELISLRQDMDLLKHQLQMLDGPFGQGESGRSFGEAKALARQGAFGGLSETTILDLLKREGFPARAARVALDAAREEVEDARLRAAGVKAM